MTTASDIKIPAPAGAFGGYLARPAGKPVGSVVVIQEIFGVNSHIRSVTRRLADAGFAALAPDLFHRAAAGVELGYDEAGIQRGFELMQQLKGEDALADIRAALAQLRALPELKGSKVGVMGFCMGGLYAYRSAANLDPDCAVAYYGGGIANYLGEAAKIRVPVQFHFGARDAHIPQDQVEQIRAATAALPGHELYVYDAEHGFHCDERPSYDATASAQAWERTLAFLRRHLAA